MQMYLLNRTYIAEDRTTGLMAYSDTERDAQEKLIALVNEYWEKKKVIVPVTKKQENNEA
ncbi:MAG TPA: hypothetical protein VGE59_02765 [Patescibacteria group bacterium]